MVMIVKYLYHQWKWWLSSEWKSFYRGCLLSRKKNKLSALETSKGEIGHKPNPYGYDSKALEVLEQKLKKIIKNQSNNNYFIKKSLSISYCLILMILIDILLLTCSNMNDILTSRSFNIFLGKEDWLLLLDNYEIDESRNS